MTAWPRTRNRRESGSSRRRSRARFALALALAGALSLSASRADSQGVSVGLVPAQQLVEPGSSFDLELQVTEPGSGFNAFDAVVRYDPAALTFLPTSPTSLQEGSYMTGACGNTFHLFSAAADSLLATDVLLCAGVSLPGPGQIYKLRFQASVQPQATIVRLASIQFYDAGRLVSPVRPSDAEVQIGFPTDVGSDVRGGFAPRIVVRPNPSFGRTVLRVESPQAGEQTMEILDVRGRLVRRLDQGTYPAGAREASWDGGDQRGHRVGAGVYLARLRTPAATAETRFVLLE